MQVMFTNPPHCTEKNKTLMKPQKFSFWELEQKQKLNCWIKSKTCRTWEEKNHTDKTCRSWEEKNHTEGKNQKATFMIRKHKEKWKICILQRKLWSWLSYSSMAKKRSLVSTSHCNHFHTQCQRKNWFIWYLLPCKEIACHHVHIPRCQERERCFGN